MYTRIEQETHEIDWYLTNRRGEIACFSSGATQLPDVIAEDKSSNETLKGYFKSLPVTSHVVVNKKLTSIRKVNSDITTYLGFFTEMTSKGLYSFDTMSPGDFSSMNYCLVTIPENPLVINDLPQEIACLLPVVELDFDSPERILSFKDITILRN